MSIDVDKLPVGELLLYQIKDLLTKLLTRPGGGGALGYPPNTKFIQVTALTALAAGVAYRGPDMVIPDGFQLVIKSAPGNVPLGLIYLGESASTCVNVGSAWPMLPNENIAYGIQNANQIYFSAANAGDNVIFTCERGG